METTSQHIPIMEEKNLETAEDFLIYYHIQYDNKLIKIKRIQLLRMYHKLLPCNHDQLTYEQHQLALKTAYRQLILGRELVFETGGCHGCND